MGADLTKGDVLEDGVRCPLHGRCFSTAGNRIDKRDASCNQHFLAASERYGLIFGFLGGEPDFPLPMPNGIEPAVLTRPSITTDDLSLLMIGANAFDTAHLSHVHGREVDGTPEVAVFAPHAIRINMHVRVVGNNWRDRLLRKFGQGLLHIETECWGGNFLIFHHRRVGTFTLHAALPRDERRTTVFTVSGRDAGPGRFDRLRQAIRLRAHHQASLSFVKEDKGALAGMQFQRGTLDPESDRSVLAWLEHFDALPRADAR
jgi:phenylpropionate dioxygenase-like ring-hydroxylating dioxygenase large terminal subunit